MLEYFFNNGVKWSFYHILHKHKHAIQLFKDGMLWGVEDCEFSEDAEKKIDIIVKVLSNDFKYLHSNS
ncbi:hypothetical protein SAMN04487895_10340 [Paenibacillus sophorae]|uniref:Uncharacterized protein n=1 Tax=Paenibacillus sophorae TaxID=1333845 RepID=A0A1H8JJD5_9BACL|nr:hypothetical protein SAMN04487895_10340 [Paenibacillus sophorae]